MNISELSALAKHVAMRTNVAPVYDAVYWEQRFQGEKGVTWDISDDWFRSKFPIFDKILREGNLIKFGMYMSCGNGIMYDFDLCLAEGESIAIHKCRRCFNPGSRYLFKDGKIYAAKYDGHGPCWTIDAFGGLVWGSGRSWVTKEWEDMEIKEDHLGQLDTIEKILMVMLQYCE